MDVSSELDDLEASSDTALVGAVLSAVEGDAGCGGDRKHHLAGKETLFVSFIYIISAALDESQSLAPFAPMVTSTLDAMGHVGVDDLGDVGLGDVSLSFNFTVIDKTLF